MSEAQRPHSELRKRIDRILGESGYMGYEGDIAEFWESVRDHGWGSVKDEGKTLIDDMRGVLIDLVEQLEAAERALAVADELAQWCRVATSVEGIFSNNIGAQAQGQGMANLVVRYAATRESYPATKPEGVADGLQASAVPAATPPYIVEQDNANPASEPKP